MATISSPGVGSGLDVNSIVTQLVAIERQPIVKLQTAASSLQTKLSAFGKLQSDLSALRDAAAALTSPSAFGASFKHGNVVTRGWASPQAIDAKRLRIGVPVTQSLTIANQGSLPATYRLKARVAGDLRLAARLSVVARRKRPPSRRKRRR